MNGMNGEFLTFGNAKNPGEPLLPDWLKKAQAAQLAKAGGEKPKFGKRWKNWLWERIRNHVERRLVRNFHFVETSSLLLCFGNKTKLLKFQGVLDAMVLRKYAETYDDCRVMAYAGLNFYLSLSAESYLKLMEISKLCIESRYLIRPDGGIDGNYESDEFEEFHQQTDVIDNINDLAQWIQFHANGIKGVYDIQAYVMCYDEFDIRFRVMILKNDGTVKTYKDINKFLGDYGLRQF